VAWSREEYLAGVLDPARKAGNVPPPDLYARYGLPDGITDPAAFAQRVAEVVAFWRELKTRRTYARLADTLLTAHAELERAGRLTLGSFAERHRDAHRERLERLRRLAEAEAGAATHVGPGTVARLRDALADTVTDAEVTQALTRAGVHIVEQFPTLPAGPHPKQADLTRHLRQLGAWLSAAVVFGDAIEQGFRVLGGFRLAGGRTLDDDALTAARSRLEVLPYADPVKTPSENVLAILTATARKPGDLDALLLSEVVERLRPLARSGFLQRGIAAQATGFGLDADDAGLIAAALLSADSLVPLRQQMEDELTGSRLRSAQRLASGLPADDPLRERVVALAAEVTALSRRAGDELAAGRPESAAKLLAEAASLARDDAELPARLAAVPPPAPLAPTARVDGNRVLISWKSSPAAAGRLQYRVMRGLDRAPASPSEGTAVITRTEQGDVTDADAVPGTELTYSVFAARGGDAWSGPASTPPVVLTPDVAEVAASVTEDSVAASWRPYPGAGEVLVVRQEQAAPRDRDDGTDVPASLTGFRETGLCTGAEYFYRIVTCYRPPDGRPRYSPGVVLRVVPEPELRPVADLIISEPDEDRPVVRAAWTPPPYGQVRLVRSDQPLPWAAGTRLRPEEAAGLLEIPGVPRQDRDGHEVLEPRLPSGRHHLMALTVGRSASVAGAAAEIWLVEPVRALSATRMHDQARLGWVWPDGATDAVIRWPGGERHCSRRVYADEGGAVITVGPGAVSVEVRGVYPRRDGRITSPGARVDVPERGVAVSYRLRPAGGLAGQFGRLGRRGPQRVSIELAAELVPELARGSGAGQAVRAPALVVVRSTGRYAPDDPSEGEVVARIEPQPLTPGQAVTVPVEVAWGPAWLACFVDPAAPAADARRILLFPPPAGEMRLR
jgi:hypothetical protein